MVAIPDPGTFQVMPTAGRRARPRARREGRADDLRRREAGRRALRGRPALRAPRRARPHEAARVRLLRRRPGARVLPLRGRPGHEDPRRGRLLRDDGAGRRDRGAQRHDPRARVGRHPDRVPPPRGRSLAARDRHALLRRARDGRPLHDVPPDREGGRRLARLLRDLHAEAALRRERLRACTRTCRSSGAAGTSSSTRRTPTTSRHREGVHRRVARPRPRDVRGARTVGELVQAARARVRGPGLRRVVTAEPLGADPHPALQAGRRAGDPRPRSAVPIRPATPTSPSRRCSTPGSRASSRDTSCPTR